MPVGDERAQGFAAGPPSYPDEQTRILSEGLEDARARKEKLIDAGGPTHDVEQEILELRRQLREGGRLKAGDSLGDGRYLLLEPLGRGGFAVVWRALDRRGSCQVAIKVLHGVLAEDRSCRERFFRGARAMAELKHGGVVRVLEPEGEDGGYHYFVMEHVPGGDLREAVLEGRILREDVVPLVLRVSEVLGFAHARGLVHRDVKPANILLDAAGAPKLTDFDLVGGAYTTGGTRTGAMGTVVYAAPELMARPQDANARADVYGLGMTAIFCLHGAELSLDVVRDAEGMIDGLPCNEDVRGVLRKATAWESDRRYGDALELCDALRAAITLAPMRRRWGAGRKSALVTAIGLLAVVPAGLNLLDSSQDARPAPSASPASPPVAECPDGMVLIPGGKFMMGSRETEAYPSEHPQHEVMLSPYCMDRTEVTVAQYRACVDASDGGARCEPAPTTVNWGGSSPAIAQFWSRFCDGGATDRDEHPINCIDWNQADTYCRWRGGGLPTEAEWEYAARGADGRQYPWGDEPRPGPSLLNGCDAECRALLVGLGKVDFGAMYEAKDGWPSTAPVGRFPAGASPFGLQDMAGNVWEWTADWYGDYTEKPAMDPVSTNGTSRVVRGGSWASTDFFVTRAAYRDFNRPTDRVFHLGFRCAHQIR